MLQLPRYLWYRTAVLSGRSRLLGRGSGVVYDELEAQKTIGAVSLCED